MNKFLAIHSNQFPGVTAVFSHANSLGLCDVATSETWPKAANLLPPHQNILFGAWHNNYKPILNQLLSQKKNVAFWWTSSIGQMEQSCELDTFYYLLDLSEKNHTTLFTSDPTISKIHGLTFIPYPIAIPNPFLTPLQNKAQNIALFLPPAPRKNIANQLAALSIINTQHLLFHNLPINIKPSIKLPFMSHEKLLQILNSMKLSLMITHTETFGYSLVDAITAGTIPIIGPSMSIHFPTIVFTLSTSFPPITCFYPDSPIEIAKTILPWLLINPQSYLQAVSIARKTLATLADSNNQYFQEVINCWINKKIK